MNLRFFSLHQSHKKKTSSNPSQLDPELLMNIFSFLDFPGLISAMQVNTTWHKIINDRFLSSSIKAFIYKEVSENARDVQLCQLLLSDSEIVQRRIAQKIAHLKIEKNKQIYEANNGKPNTLKVSALALGMGAAIFDFPLIKSGFCAYNSPATVMDVLDCLIFNLYPECPDNMTYKEYLCDPYFLIALLLIGFIMLLGIIYKVEQEEAMQNYRNNPHYPYKNLPSVKALSAEPAEIKYENAMGETLPLPSSPSPNRL